MLGYKQILIASDLSEHTDKIVATAADIAQADQAQLSIVHVMEHSPVAYGGEFTIPIDVNVEQVLEAHVREELAKIGDKYNIPPSQQHIASGAVKLAVIDTADEINADLIVVGTHGHRGVSLLLGSRANAILHLAKCDVWVIRIKEAK